MRQEFSEDYLSHYYWIKDGDALPWRNDEAYDGKITVEGTEYAAATDLDDASVEALTSTKKILIKPPSGWVSMELRFRSDGSDDDDSVIQLFAACGVDFYRHIGEVTLTQGKQLYSTGIYFVDTVALTDTWLTATAEPSPTDSIASLVLNIHGYDRFFIICSDLDTTTLYCDFRRH